MDIINIFYHKAFFISKKFSHDCLSLTFIGPYDLIKKQKSLWKMEGANKLFR